MNDLLDEEDGNLQAVPDWQREPWERAPSHMVEYDEGYIGLNTKKLAKLSAKASASRTDERNQQIIELKNKYPRHWGKRGGAGFIARSETKKGNPISERTVRGYCKKTDR
jgi:hypothetical protein